MARRIRDPMTLPTVYVVSLACVPERRRRMIRRLREQKIPFEIVEAHDDRSTRIDFYAPGETHPQRRRIAACLASHLDALRSFVESGAKEAVVVEDDVRPIRDLHRRFHEVRANVPDGTPLVCLSYLVWSWSGFLWAEGSRRRRTSAPWVLIPGEHRCTGSPATGLGNASVASFDL